jgi:hypothetical protein
MALEFLAHIRLEFLRTTLKLIKRVFASNVRAQARRNLNVSSAEVLARIPTLILFAMHVTALVFSMGNRAIGANQAYMSVGK